MGLLSKLELPQLPGSKRPTEGRTEAPPEPRSPGAKSTGKVGEAVRKVAKAAQEAVEGRAQDTTEEEGPLGGLADSLTLAARVLAADQQMNAALGAADRRRQPARTTAPPPRPRRRRARSGSRAWSSTGSRAPRRGSRRSRSRARLALPRRRKRPPCSPRHAPCSSKDCNRSAEARPSRVTRRTSMPGSRALRALAPAFFVDGADGGEPARGGTDAHRRGGAEVAAGRRLHRLRERAASTAASTPPPSTWRRPR